MKKKVSFEDFNKFLNKHLKNGGPNPSFNHSYIENKNKVTHYLLKYEDMVNDPYETIINILTFFHYDYDSVRVKEALNKNTFKTLSGGRAIGNENKLHHYRKGIIGDWKNYLTEEMNNNFCERHQKLLDVWGYKK